MPNPFQVFGKELLIPLKAAEPCAITVAGVSGDIWVTDPDGRVTARFAGTVGAHSFTATVAGVYSVQFGNWGRVSAVSRPCGWHVSPAWSGESRNRLGSGEMYFDVTPGTERFILTVVDTFNQDTSFHLFDPAGVELWGRVTGGAKEHPFEAPVPGIWKLVLDAKPKGSDIALHFINPLVWHDPAGLARVVPPPPPPPSTADQVILLAKEIIRVSGGQA